MKKLLLIQFIDKIAVRLFSARPYSPFATAEKLIVKAVIQYQYFIEKFNFRRLTYATILIPLILRQADVHPTKLYENRIK